VPTRPNQVRGARLPRQVPRQCQGSRPSHKRQQTPSVRNERGPNPTANLRPMSSHAWCTPNAPSCRDASQGERYAGARPGHTLAATSTCQRGLAAHRKRSHPRRLLAALERLPRQRLLGCPAPGLVLVCSIPLDLHYSPGGRRGISAICVCLSYQVSLYCSLLRGIVYDFPCTLVEYQSQVPQAPAVDITALWYVIVARFIENH
jgi:hypothetical protein